MQLNPGDKIGICATGDKISRTSIKKGLNFIKNYKLIPVLGKNLFKSNGCFAGTDEKRLYDINHFIKDKNIKGIFFAKGGYGSARLLAKIDYSKLKNHNKIIMGFSDTTSILLAISSITKTTTFYGPMLSTDLNIKNNLLKKSFSDLFLKKHKILEYDLQKYNFKILKKSKKKIINGKIIAGCLSIFVTMLGTPYLKLPKKYILFLEDIKEEPYKIDRMLVHIKNTGVLKNCNGILLDFNKCVASPKNKDTLPIKNIIVDIFKDYNFPVLEWKYFGHRKEKIILPIGNKADIYISKKILKISKI